MIIKNTLFDLWEDHIAILSQDGTITYVNKSWKQFASENGLSPDNCSEGTNYLKICDEAAGANSKEAPFVAKNIRDVISGNTDSFEIEYPCHSPDKKRWFLLKVFPLSDVFPTHVLLQHMNITARKQAELKVVKSENKFKNYIDRAPEGFFAIDENCYLTEVNPSLSKINGYSEKELIGMHASAFFEPEDWDLILVKLNHVYKNGSVNLETKFYDKNKISKWINITASKISDSQVIGFVTDISARKNAELKLQKALKKSHRREKEVVELLNATQFVLNTDDFETVAEHVFHACARNIGAKAGYVALLSESGEENELLFLEDGGMECFVDRSLPMPIRGLRAEAYSTGKVVYDNDFMKSEWVKYMPRGHMILSNVLFAPLNIAGKTVGIMGFACKEGNFTENDARLAKTFGEYAAIALKNSISFDAMEKSEEKYRQIFETAANFITSVDQNGIIVNCNNQARNFLGYERNELIGQSMGKIIHPDFMDKAVKSLQEILETGFSYNKEYKMVKKSGELIDVVINSSGVDNGKEEYENTICIINDVTKQKESIERVEYLSSVLNSIRSVNQLIVKEKAQEKLLQGICDILTKKSGFHKTIICLFDRDGKVSIIRENGLGDSLYDFKLKLDNGQLPYCFQSVLGEQSLISIEYPFEECSGCPLKNKYGKAFKLVSRLEYDDTIYGVIVTAIPLKYSDDYEIIGLFEEVVGDISFALYNLELESISNDAEVALLEGKIAAEEANRVKSEFLATMSHELRTPLTAVIGFSDLLSNERFGTLTETQADFVSRINESGGHLLELIDNILDLSKFESGKMELFCERFLLTSLLYEIQAIIEPKTTDKKISFVIENEIKDEIYADKIKIKQVILNLLSNAIKFTPEYGEVKLLAKIQENLVHITISDTGIGIPLNMQKAIFNPFTQVDSSNRRKYGGTGLGLALVSNYVKLHGGTVWVDSEETVGSTFKFTIPLILKEEKYQTDD